MSDRKNDIRARLMTAFQAEARELLQALRAQLMDLEQQSPPAQLQAMVETTFRTAHTLKGAARSVGLVEVEGVCQAMEAVLSRLRHQEIPLTRELLDVLHETAAAVQVLAIGGEGPAPAPDLLSRLQEQQGQPALPATRPPREDPVSAAQQAETTPSPAVTIRVETAKLDTLLVEIEELLPVRLAAGERMQEARSLLEAMGRGQQSPEGSSAHESRALQAQAGLLVAHLARDEQAVTRALQALQERVHELRLSPAVTVLELLPPMVRDLAREQGKEIDLTLQGADLRLDRRVLDLIKDPLIHLVRNAVDHGLETPEAREKAGKTRRGLLSVAMTALEGGRVELLIQDDGAGIDPDRVRAAAVRARLMTAQESQARSDDEALQLIFQTGLSTSPIITRISGHGVGLAVVQERINQLGGQIELHTRVGEGTAFRMVLPASVTTFRGLLVREGGRPFLLPIAAVERAIRLSPADVEHVEGRQTVRWEGRLIAVAHLGQLLGLHRSDGRRGDGRMPCVVLRVGTQQAALVVEAVAGHQEVLVRELKAPLAGVRHVSGAGVLGDGEVALILRAADLIAASHHLREDAAAPAAARPATRTILVVDDSITTRTMEKNILEAAGFQVRVSMDGADAWTVLKSEPFDLVVSDVDMPRMDGFELTSRIRADERLRDLPVILVTALESRSDKERGIAVGANAYVIKSSFEQSNLLEIIQRLL